MPVKPNRETKASKMKKPQKSKVTKYLIAGAIILVVIAIGLFILLRSGDNLVTEDSKHLALSQSDVPSNFVPISQTQFAGATFTGYKDDAYWVKRNKRKEIAVNRGFQNGYVSAFIYVSPDAFSNFSVKTIGSSISIYSYSGAREALDESKKEIENLTRFDIPKIGDDSMGYYATETLPDAFTITKYCISCGNDAISRNSTDVLKTYYEISFVKNNVYAWVGIGQTGNNVNLADEAIKYANIVASKIK
ncbi:MAG: hypothetical protein V1811_01680 [Candidatus Micrarchaeota archaeon]